MTKQLGRTRLVFPPAAFSLLETRMWRWEEMYRKCLVNHSGSGLLLFQHFLSLRRACPQGQDSPSGSPPAQSKTGVTWETLLHRAGAAGA